MKLENTNLPMTSSDLTLNDYKDLKLKGTNIRGEFTNPFALSELDGVPAKPLIEVAPVMNYILNSIDFLIKVKKVDRVVASKIMIDIVRKDMKDPKISYYYKDEFGDKNLETTTLTQYIKDAYRLKEALVPSFTRYKASEEDGGVDSLHKAVTSANLAKRAKAKHQAAVEYAEGNLWEASELTNLQKTLKLLNNAMSGAFASPSTIHYNPSAHYTLTSITRSTSSIGNIISEMVIGGNRLYGDLDVTLSHIITTATQIHDTDFMNMLRAFKIHIPTVDELCEMVKDSTVLYWTSKKWDNIIRLYLEGTNDLERCKIMYANDLFNLYKYNKPLVRQMIVDLAQKEDGNEFTEDEQVAMCKGQPDYVANLSYHICSDEIRGIKFNPDKHKGDYINRALSGTMLNIHYVLEQYRLIFRALFNHRVLPVNVAGTKEMVRKVIVLSDTDSTCATYGWWVEEILGSMRYDSIGIGISAAVMTITSLATSTAIDVFTDNMNVGTKSKGLLEMKNEYFWKTFAIGKGTKHYYASVYIKEGMVFKEPKLELKGSQFILSKVPLEFREISDNMFKDINNEVISGEKLSLKKYINRVLDVEKGIRDRIYSGDFTILQSTEIKDSSAYKIPKSSPYEHYNLWKEVFEDKYGIIDKPPYLAIKYSLELPTKGRIKTFVEGIKDETIKEKLRKYVENNNKASLNTILLPFELVEANGIPEELKPVVNIRKIINGICKSMYLTLSTLGFHLPKDAIILDMGYDE